MRGSKSAPFFYYCAMGPQSGSGGPKVDDRNHRTFRLLSLVGYQSQTNLYNVRFWTFLTRPAMKLSLLVTPTIDLGLINIMPFSMGKLGNQGMERGPGF